MFICCKFLKPLLPTYQVSEITTAGNTAAVSVTLPCDPKAHHSG